MRALQIESSLAPRFEVITDAAQMPMFPRIREHALLSPPGLIGAGAARLPTIEHRRALEPL